MNTRSYKVIIINKNTQASLQSQKHIQNMSTNSSFFDEEGAQFIFKPLGLKGQRPIEIDQKPTLISSLSCKDLTTGDTINGVFALHNALLAFYNVKFLKPICLFYRTI